MKHRGPRWREPRVQDVREMVQMVTENVSGGSIPDRGHFVPEERPDEIVRQIRVITAKANEQ